MEKIETMKRMKEITFWAQRVSVIVKKGFKQSGRQSGRQTGSQTDRQAVSQGDLDNPIKVEIGLYKPDNVRMNKKEPEPVKKSFCLIHITGHSDLH